MPSPHESGLVCDQGWIGGLDRVWRPEQDARDIPHLLPPDDYGDCVYRYDQEAQLESWHYGQGPQGIQVTLAYPFAERKTAYLPRIEISPELRGQGIGSQVIESISGYLLKRGYEYLVVVAEPLRRGERDPRPFYARVGFQKFDPWSYCRVMPYSISEDPSLEMYLALDPHHPI